MAVVPSPGARVTVAESLNRDLVRVNAWCDLWGMKLNTSKTKTMIVFRSRTMHPQSNILTIDCTVLKESDDLDILGVTFDSKLTFEKHLRSVSRAASLRLGILRKSSRFDQIIRPDHSYSMVWDWRDSRAGPVPFCWPSCSLLFCLQLFSLSLLFLYRLVVWGWGLRTDRVSISLSRPCIANIF